ncbi:MAG: polyprenyl synthetase family protein [Candidatus Eremiobacteraeota bacterium]|nr:polyprenyl synthetase family protein [Candidatus Eremiobacteraeota bacterium]
MIESRTPFGIAAHSDRDLLALVEQFFGNAFSTDNEVITEAVRRMLAAGGKRLRPRFTLLAVEANGGDALQHLPLAAYMELIHVGTLIHDDVVDRADTRRGVNATAVDFGNRVSVLAGDYLFAWIFKNVTAHYPHPIPNILATTLAEITDGEVLQHRAVGRLALKMDDYIEIAVKKTATLFAASAECGAIMAGASPRRVKALRDYGMYYGIAFQMLDDLLDFTASESEIGKPVGNDLREHKMTLPLILALEAPDPQFREALGRFYSGEDGRAETPQAVDRLVEGVVASGGLEKTREAIAGYVERAKISLAPLGIAPARAELTALADALARDSAARAR